MSRTRAKGIRRKGAGWEAFVKVGGRLSSTMFPLSASREEMHAWRASTRAEALARLHRETAATTPALAHTFAADVLRYLRAVSSMPTLAERQAHLELWVAALGATRDRRGITTDEINAVLHQWARDGGRRRTRQGWTPVPLAPSSLLHRRNALLHLWHVLDGKDAPNPVRRAWRPQDRKPASRALHPGTITRILAALPARPSRQKTRARLLVLATTGLPQRQLEQLTPRDVQDAIATKRLRVSGRLKGGGTSERILPLAPAAVVALRNFDAQQAYGTYSTSSQYQTWKRACAKVGVTNARPYDLKHSFGTLLLKEGQDLSSVARLLGVSLSTAQRYTLGAHDEVDAALVTAAAPKLPSLPAFLPTAAPARASKKTARR